MFKTRPLLALIQHQQPVTSRGSRQKSLFARQHRILNSHVSSMAHNTESLFNCSVLPLSPYDCNCGIVSFSDLLQDHYYRAYLCRLYSVDYLNSAPAYCPTENLCLVSQDNCVSHAIFVNVNHRNIVILLILLLSLLTLEP